MRSNIAFLINFYLSVILSNVKMQRKQKTKWINYHSKLKVERKMNFKKLWVILYYLKNKLKDHTLKYKMEA